MIELGLSRIEHKAAAPRSVADGRLMHLPEQPRWPSTDPQRLMREGFGANVTVYGCVMGWARPISGLSWYLVRKPRAGVKGARFKKIFTPETAMKALGSPLGKKSVARAEVSEHPILRLKEKPNPMLDGASFDEAHVAYLLTTGNAYAELVPALDGRIVQLWQPLPHQMKVVPGVGGVAGYKQTTDDGRTIPFTVDEIDHLRLFGGLDPWYGLSPLAAAARSVDSDNEAQRWAYALLVNDMRPPGAFVAKSTLPDISYHQLKKQIRDRQGAKGAGKPLVLDNGLEWVNFALSPAEVDWIKSRENWQRDIAVAYNYGSELLGDVATHRTQANRVEALRAHYSENIMPLATRIRNLWNDRIVPTYGDGLYLDFDRDQIEALQEDREKLWLRVESSRELTINEKRQAKGYEPVRGGDVILVSSGDVPLEMAGADSPVDVVKGQILLPRNQPFAAQGPND